MKYSDKFDTLGFFYQIEEKNFRRYLHIKAKQTTLTKPDLMVVMMNPGGSIPRAGFKNNYDKEVDTIYDRTQEHIMDVMIFGSFQYARILNLSDYCNKSSNDFYKMIPTLTTEYPGHTIFDESRKDFNSLFDSNAHIIFAWGVNSRIKSLAENAINRIASKNVIGLKKKDSNFGYYHPMRRISESHNKSWTYEVLEIFKKNQNK